MIEALTLVRDEVVKDLFEFSGIVLAVKGKARKGYKGFPQEARELSGITGVDHRVTVVMGYEKVCAAKQLLASAGDGRSLL